ncbi:hypothetical protein ACXZ9C_10970 [Streptococcus agalactiae]
MASSRRVARRVASRWSRGVCRVVVAFRQSFRRIVSVVVALRGVASRRSVGALVVAFRGVASSSWRRVAWLVRLACVVVCVERRVGVGVASSCLVLV